MSPSISPRTKRVTRRALLAQRDALSEAERAARSAKIAEAVDALLEENAEEDLGVVALYAAKGSEVDTAAIDAAVRARGLTVAYPRVIGDATALAFHAVRIDELVLAGFGLREPRPDAPAVDLLQIGVFFVPGLAFDRAGGRIGWGRGHYDVTLAASPAAWRVGLAYDFQVVDEVPREAHDTLLHTIITEVTTYQVA
ncbi:MAG TPA: 5-formyltetrahydrofolate cyclo-ligase [Kofleriaceae bacterium]|nr:5-formyltetrahydrofolate cyclo-ligase [Kofleriaceae bacterium]